MITYFVKKYNDLFILKNIIFILIIELHNLSLIYEQFY
jgi:hypothetical protein